VSPEGEPPGPGVTPEGRRPAPRRPGLVGSIVDLETEKWRPFPARIESRDKRLEEGKETAKTMVATARSLMNKLLREGVSKSEVARRLGVSRQTVYDWIERGDEAETPRRRPSKLDPFRRQIESRLERFDLPATVLLKEIKEKGYDGRITILRDYVAGIKARHVQRVVDRFETEPGRQAQVDWGSCGTMEHEGRRRRLSLLVVVLGYSRTIWARFVVSERRPILMELLEDSFRELNGVPHELLFDNLKQVVAQPRRPDVTAPADPGGMRPFVPM